MAAKTMPYISLYINIPEIIELSKQEEFNNVVGLEMIIIQLHSCDHKFRMYCLVFK